jgi:hypothetical protein
MPAWIASAMHGGWATNADGHLPKVKKGMRDQPRRGRRPHSKAHRWSHHANAESYAEEHLDNSDIADEVLVIEASRDDARDKEIPLLGAMSMNSPFPKRNRPLNAAMTNTPIETARFMVVMLSGRVDSAPRCG